MKHISNLREYDMKEENMKWKNKYNLSYCELCETWTITCEKCGNSSCNGSSCEECHKDSIDFSSNYITSDIQYLNKEEIDILEKSKHLKKYIGECLEAGFHAINWEWLKKEGKLSEYSEKIFKQELEQLEHE